MLEAGGLDGSAVGVDEAVDMVVARLAKAGLYGGDDIELIPERSAVEDEIGDRLPIIPFWVRYRNRRSSAINDVVDASNDLAFIEPSLIVHRVAAAIVDFLDDGANQGHYRLRVKRGLSETFLNVGLSLCFSKAGDRFGLTNPGSRRRMKTGLSGVL